MSVKSTGAIGPNCQDEIELRLSNRGMSEIQKILWGSIYYFHVS